MTAHPKIAAKLAVDLAAIFGAGRTRRWHANAWLSDTVDPVEAHAGRVARIIVALHPAPSALLLAAALVHDDGENGQTGIGDMPGPVKERLDPEVREALEIAEGAALVQLWRGTSAFRGMPLCARDERWLAFADRLDRLMWSAWHRPGLLSQGDWPALIHRVEGEAVALGAAVNVRALLAVLGD